MSNESTRESNDSARLKTYLTGGLLSALFLWGAYLAVGAFLFDRSRTKGIIVFGCSLALLLLWAIVLKSNRRSGLPVTDSAARSSNVMSILSFILSGAAGLIMTAAVSGRFAGTFVSDRRVLFFAFVAALVSAVFAVVGLSDATRERLRSLGFVSLLLCVATLIGGFFVPAL